jgi:23S rRNA (adenine-N6)-dimethyltransferase
VPAARRRRATPDPAGAHALAEHTAARLVHRAGIGPDELVLDLGAGMGAVTRPLARTGARIIAVERDEKVGARLCRRLRGLDNVTVVIGDALRVPLPHRAFRVVANPPFAITTPLLRRLVDSRMTGADLVVAYGAGRRLVGDPARPELARWHRRFEFTLGQWIPAARFRPVPPVDAVVLRLRRRVTGR